MQLTCPNCGARYRIDASDWPTDPGPEGDPGGELVFRPRRARCKVCRSVWSATPEEAVLELDDPLPPDEEHPRLADAAWASVGHWPDPRPVAAPQAPQPDFAPALDRPPPVFVARPEPQPAPVQPPPVQPPIAQPTVFQPAAPAPQPLSALTEVVAFERPPPVFTPPTFTPRKDPALPLYAAPARPSIHFEAPPVPIPAEPVSGSARPAIRTRLPGPGAGYGSPPAAIGPAAAPPVDAAPRAPPAPRADPPAFPDPGVEPGADPAADPVYGYDEEDADDEAPGRRWLWPVVALLLVLAAWAFLVLSGRIQPEDFGLPPYNPAAIGLPAVAVPAVTMPAVKLPRAAPSPLTIEAEVLRRRLPDARQVWEIAGTIRNPTARPQPVPPVEILLLDAAGRDAGRWTVRPEAQNVAAGGAVRFETSAIDPPSRAVRLRMLLKPAELGRL